jgi:transposase
MPYRQISRDVKLAAIRLHEQALLPLPDILDCLRISRATFYRILQLWRTTGDVVRHSSGIQGRPQSMNLDNIDYLKHLISHHADWFLDELQYLLATNRFISVHFTTIHRELGRAQVSTKKLRKIAIKRNVNLRADFIRRMAQYRPEQLGFLDEVSKDERTSARRYGRSMKGRRTVKKGVFVHGRRFSAEGLLTIDGMVSTTVIEGPMTRLRFLKYLEHSVVCRHPYIFSI